MHIWPAPYAWDVTPSAAIGVQESLRNSVRTDILVSLDSVRFVAGVDVSSSRFNPLLTAGIVLWDRKENRVVETASAQANATFPYIPGLLSFREIPILLQAIKALKREPDVWLVDGQGIAHFRRLGIASHFGVLIDRPTIGVAKSRLVGTYNEVGLAKGDRSDLMMGDEQIGVVFRSKEKSNPLFISPGHRIDITSSITIVEACLRGYRLPEPTRLAHFYVNDVRTGKVQPALL